MNHERSKEKPKKSNMPMSMRLPRSMGYKYLPTSRGDMLPTSRGATLPTSSEAFES